MARRALAIAEVSPSRPSDSWMREGLGASGAATLTQRLLAVFAASTARHQSRSDRRPARRRNGRSAAAGARRDRRAEDCFDRGAVAGAGRRRTSSRRDPQPRDQRARRHAGRRQADDRDRRMSISTTPTAAAQLRRQPGPTTSWSPSPTRASECAAMCSRSALRSVLHHQGDRQGYRAWACQWSMAS